MKNRFLLLFAVAVLIWSCNEENLDLTDANTADELNLENNPDVESDNICLTKDIINSDSINGRVSSKGYYWNNGQTIRIKFLNGSSSQQNTVKYYAAEWLQYANLRFQYVSYYENADIKIKFESSRSVGGWSYVGTYAKNISQYQPSMSLSNLKKGTILHEFGHALGLEHEHQNPTAQIAWNRPYVYSVMAKQGWSRKEVEDFIFNKLSRANTEYSYIDDASIMIYNIPRSWTTNGFYSKGNNSLSRVDRGQIGLMYPSAKPGLRTHALYRYWSGFHTDHFYTTNYNELKGGGYSYVYEGYMGYLEPTQVSGTVALHRYWNAGGGDHFYTTNYNSLGDKKYGWVYEGIIGYIYTSKASNRKPLYRYWNGKAGDHFYTTNWNEIGSGKHGYKYEGVVGYLKK